MITRTIQTDTPDTSYLTNKHDPKDLLFFDIETTGFSPHTSNLYLIGVLYFEQNTWMLRQWIAEQSHEEASVLNTFLDFAAPYSKLVHFNGIRFDLPYLKAKCLQYGLTYLADSFNHIDLYLCFKPLKKYLKLQHLNQKSLEEFLLYKRDDLLTGGELIPIYGTFCTNHAPELLELLLLHNHDDLKGMLAILPLFTYLDLIKGHLNILFVEFSADDSKHFSLLIRGKLPQPIPRTISYHFPDGYLTATDTLCKIQLQGIQGSVKYFFKDFRNYCYLPEEDTVIHKSLAVYMDKSYRIPAKASTCYQKKSGLFLPQSKELFTPSFKIEHGDSVSYFEYTDDMKEDYERLLSYIQDRIIL